MKAIGRLIILMILVVSVTDSAFPRQSGPADYIPGILVYKLERSTPESNKGQGGDAGTDSVTDPVIRDNIRSVLEYENVRSTRRVMPESGYREAKMTAHHRGQADRTETPDDLTRTFIAHYDSGTDPVILAAKLASLPGVEYAEPMYVYELAVQPSDPLISTNGHDYFGYHRFFGAWEISKSSEDVVIAIVDSGVDYTHEDLKTKLWRNPEPGRARAMFPDIFSEVVNDTIGWDFWQSGPPQAPVQSSDPMGRYEDHGTHVAGTAAADTDNGIGIAGTGWNARYMAVKAGGTQDFPRSIAFGYQGVLYAAVNGADIINCSWGGGTFSRFGQDVVRLATAMGSLVIGAAGNSNTDQDFYPASYPEVLSVGSVDYRTGQKSGFSNSGYSVDVLAAGTSISSTVFNNQYGLKSGTSMAAPVVSGLAALIRSHHPDWGPLRIATQIRATAQSVDDSHRISLQYKLGTGVVNALEAIRSEKPGIRLLDVRFINLAGDKLDIGEEGQAVLRLINYGTETSQLNLSLESRIPGIEISGGDSSPSIVSTGSETEMRFNIRIRPDFNLSNTPLFMLRMVDEASGYNDFSVFGYDTIIYDNHQANKILTTVTSSGTIGYLDALSSSGGIGFIPFNEETGAFDNQSILFEGALMIETTTDTVSYILDQARKVDAISRDFTPLTGFQFRAPLNPGDPTYGRGEFTTLNSGNAPHIDIELETYSFDDPGLEKSMIFSYSVTNLSGVRLNDTRIGLFNDWDIFPYNENHTTYDQEGDFLYVSSARESEPYAAVAHMGSVSSALAIDNLFSGTADSLRFGLMDGFSDEEKSWSLRAGLNRTNLINTDVSVVTASGPFHIEPEATAVVGFVYAYGSDVSELRLQIQNARNSGHELFRISSPGLVVKEDSPFSEIPESTHLYPNYPNPFNPDTNVRYYLDTGGEILLSVYDVLGRRITTLAEGTRPQGSHTVTFNASGLSSGVYFLILDSNGTRQTRKMMLLK